MNDILQKPKPNSLEAERAIISSWFLDPDKVGEAADAGVTTDSFYDPDNKLVADCIIKAYQDGREIDELTISDCLRRNDVENALQLVNGISQTLETTLQHDRYLTILRSSSDRRKLYEIGFQLVDRAETDDPQTLISEIDKVLLEVGEGDAQERLHDPQKFDEVGWAYLEKRMASGGKLGVTTGIDGIDYKLRGLKPAELSLLAARPSVGKTALSLHIFWEAAVLQRVPTLYCSLEMSAAPLATRIWQAQAGVSGAVIDDGALNENQIKSLERARNRLRQADYWVEETPGMTVAQIRMRARRMKPKGLGLIIIDYCQLIGARDRKAPREQQVAEISQSLKNLAKELDIPVLLLCQLNRSSEQAKRPPILSDLRESGQLEQDADSVLFLHKEDPETNIVTCDIAKNRNGPIGKTKLEFNKPTQRFTQYVEPQMSAEMAQQKDLLTKPRTTETTRYR